MAASGVVPMAALLTLFLLLSNALSRLWKPNVYVMQQSSLTIRYMCACTAVLQKRGLLHLLSPGIASYS
eukprot:1912957-Amphidinium_carterae.1